MDEKADRVEREYPRYSSFVREERHLAAILFHILNIYTEPGIRGFLSKFIKTAMASAGQQWLADGKSVVYFEFAYLRDYWNKQLCSDVKKRDFILECLKNLGAQSLVKKLPPSDNWLEFNKFFMEVKGDKNSEKKSRSISLNIESPGHWRPEAFKVSIEKHLGVAECKEGIKAATYLKWLFNIKPDLVIQISEKRAICIECKYESRESIYGDKKGEHIHQTKLQQILMTKILGLECYCMTITRTGKGGTLCWSKIAELYRGEKQISEAMLEALQQTVGV
jgi:hypothetical protein